MARKVTLTKLEKTLLHPKHAAVMKAAAASGGALLGCWAGGTGGAVVGAAFGSLLESAYLRAKRK
jgi:hypothetical protein